jgi:homoserine kinase
VPFTVRVPASTSNLGAGFDCVGLALDLWLEVNLLEGAGPPAYSGTLAGLDPKRDLIAQRLGAATLAGPWRLAVHSEIPVGKGLGSSGAAVVAGLALVELARGASLDRERLLAQASEIEGHPDNVGSALFGGLFLASRHPRRLDLAPGVAVALAVPERSLDTHSARAHLPPEVPRAVAIAQAARAAALILGLTRGDPELIAHGMDDQIAVPYRKDLIPGFEQAVAGGRAAGAYGVTISGAGSSLLGLCPPAAAAAVAGAMAKALTGAGNTARPLTPGVTESGLVVG